MEKALRPLGRVPHSVIGSSCIGASVFGGVCNNSGGALIHRGPAFTQMTLYAQVGDDGRIHLVNHLGLDLGDDVETMLDGVQAGDFPPHRVLDDPLRQCSDHGYQRDVRDIDADTPGRFNADPKRLFEASGSAGKVMLLAVRLDTFPKDAATADFYIGTNDPDDLSRVRRHILTNFGSLPIQGEYLHRDAFEIAERYGRDTFLAVKYLGTDRLPAMFAVKGWFDAVCARFGFLPADLSDKIMQVGSRLFPKHLPKRLYEYHDRYDHHLMLRMGEEGIGEARAYLATVFPSGSGDFFECSKDEGDAAFLHRFAAAGAANRYRAVHGDTVEDILALDVALPRNTTEWFETLPRDLTEKIERKLYYGHFFCHVFHQDYIVRKGNDPAPLEESMWRILDSRHAEYPAEHNVGHLYHAKPALVAHYKGLDPCNCFNPGIGKTSKLTRWKQV